MCNCIEKLQKEFSEKTGKNVYPVQGYNYTMDYVKGIACRAAGVERFNDISPEALSRLYHEFCKKQKIVATKNDLWTPMGLN